MVNWMKRAHLFSNLLLNYRGPFCRPTFTLRFLITFLNEHTRKKPIGLPLMYIMYANASNNTPFYTHINSQMVWRVHPYPHGTLRVKHTIILMKQLRNYSGTCVQHILILGPLIITHKKMVNMVFDSSPHFQISSNKILKVWETHYGPQCILQRGLPLKLTSWYVKLKLHIGISLTISIIPIGTYMYEKKGL